MACSHSSERTSERISTQPSWPLAVRTSAKLPSRSNISSRSPNPSVAVASRTCAVVLQSVAFRPFTYDTPNTGRRGQNNQYAPPANATSTTMVIAILRFRGMFPIAFVPLILHHTRNEPTAVECPLHTGDRMELLDKLKPLGLLGLRAALAMIFIYHGFPKLTHTHQYVQDFAQYGFPAYFVVMAAMLETFGGGLILVGLFHPAGSSTLGRRDGGGLVPGSFAGRRIVSVAAIPTAAGPGRRIVRVSHHRRGHALWTTLFSASAANPRAVPDPKQKSEDPESKQREPYSSWAHWSIRERRAALPASRSNIRCSR